MTKQVVRLCLLGCLIAGPVSIAVDASQSSSSQPQSPASAPPQAATQPSQLPELPPLLVIYREEVRPGRTAAHAANEAAWAAAFRQAGAPQTWLAMTTMAGVTEAWFISPHATYEAIQKTEDAVDANAALRAQSDKLSAQDGELLNRTSTIIAGYRPRLSYQPQVKMPDMRYMQVDVMQVKPGRDADFRRAWQQIADAHTKAKMDEHWATYEVDAGGQDLTFFFFYPRRTLAELDRSGPMHVADAYRDAVGESGRNEQRALLQDALESTRTLLFKLQPKMSVLPKEFTDGDPAFWTPPAAPVKK